MPKISRGHRIGKQGRLGLGCSAAIFDAGRSEILLVKRSDDGRWAVPGGYMESGETLQEACEREVLEEAGVTVQVTNLIAAYSDSDILLEYPDGNKWQLAVLHFEATWLEGTLESSDETADAGYFSLEQIEHMDLNDFDRARVADSFAFQGQTFLRDRIGLA